MLHLFTAPAPPEDFQIQSHTSSTVTLSWKRPRLNFGNVTKFHVLHWEEDYDTPKGVEMNAENREHEKIEFVLSGLKSNTKYRVQVSLDVHSCLSYW